jgi:hypothetical protein
MYTGVVGGDGDTHALQRCGHVAGELPRRAVAEVHLGAWIEICLCACVCGAQQELMGTKERAPSLHDGAALKRKLLPRSADCTRSMDARPHTHTHSLTHTHTHTLTHTTQHNATQRETTTGSANVLRRADKVRLEVACNVAGFAPHFEKEIRSVRASELTKIENLKNKHWKNKRHRKSKRDGPLSNSRSRAATRTG